MALEEASWKPLADGNQPPSAAEHVKRAGNTAEELTSSSASSHMRLMMLTVDIAGIERAGLKQALKLNSCNPRGTRTGSAPKP